MVELEELEEKFKIKLDEWQKKMILSESRYIIAKCGRKCGKTLAIAMRIVYRAMNRDYSNSDGICIISRGQRQAREVFMTVRQMLSSFFDFHKNIHKDEGAYTSMTMIRLPNGNKIHSLPSGYDGVTLRTYSFAEMYRDEDAFIPEAVDAAVGACLAVYGICEVRTSTPNGTGGGFYKAWFSGEYERFEMSTEQCPRVSKAFLKKEKNRMTKAEYAQEYLAKFIDIADSIFSGPMIANCTDPDIDFEELKKTCPVFVGVDFARFGEDYNAIALNYWKDGINHVKVHVIKSRWRTTEVVGKIASIIEEHGERFHTIVTDSGSMGGGAEDQLLEVFQMKDIPTYKLIGVQNQSRVPEEDGKRSKFLKVHLYRHLIRLMENGKIKFEDNIEIVRSLRSMKYKYTMYHDLTIYGHNNHACEAIVRAVFPILKGDEPYTDIYFGSVSHGDDITW